MAAANATLTGEMQEFETSSATVFKATKSFPNMPGRLKVVGANAVYVAFPNALGQDVTPVAAETGLQPGQLKLLTTDPPIDVPTTKVSFQFLSVTGASALQWIPGN